MISINGLKYIKVLAEIQVNSSTEECAFGIIKNNIIDWIVASNSFNVDEFKVGYRMDDNNKVFKAVSEKKVITEEILLPSSETALKITAIPMADDKENVVGVFVMLYPSVKGNDGTYKDFTSGITEILQGGSFLTLSNSRKIIKRQPSRNFEIPDIGFDISRDLNAMDAIKTGKNQREDIGVLDYRRPVRVLSRIVNKF